MDFARRQLEKYGWNSGKGLGKHENGISEAIKPKLKRSVTGIGHDAAAEFNEHWWSALYDKAAKNVEVEEKNGKMKKIKTIEEFTITNSTWKINKKNKNNNDNEYSEYFIKKAVLTNDGTKVENVSDSESENANNKKDVFKMTDEELFKACEGRTAHKGARHGLRALGKLARIEQQEQLLLTQTKYEGYSHAKKLRQEQGVIEDTSVVDDEEEKRKYKRKKKKKCHFSNEFEANHNCEQAESGDMPLPEKKKIEATKNASCASDADCGRNNEKCDDQVSHNDKNFSSIVESAKKLSKKKKRKYELVKTEPNNFDLSNIVETTCDVPQTKKKKK